MSQISHCVTMCPLFVNTIQSDTYSGVEKTSVAPLYSPIPTTTYALSRENPLFYSIIWQCLQAVNHKSGYAEGL